VSSRIASNNKSNSAGPSTGQWKYALKWDFGSENSRVSAFIASSASFSFEEFIRAVQVEEGRLCALRDRLWTPTSSKIQTHSAHGEYEATFRGNAIDDTVLPNLTEEDLKDLGVGIVGHRRTLLDAIAAALRAGADATPPTPSSPLLPTATVAAASMPGGVGERRHVTVMFCDLADSTGIAAKLERETHRIP
jgi:hypothetical protein